MSGDTGELCGFEGQGDREIERGDVETCREETERLQAVDDGLFVILQRSGLSPQVLSGLVKDKDSFGLALMSVWLYMQSAKLGRVPVDPPKSVDLSGTRGLSPEKIFLFLEFLPPSVEELTLDRVAVRGAALPLFLRFLRKVAGRLRFNFAENSLDPKDAQTIFPLLLPHLESLSLKGNVLGMEGVSALTQAIRDGHAGRLLSLDLENTGLTKDLLEVLCGAVQETGLRVESLNLSGVQIGFAQMRVLLPILCVGSLPCVRVLQLRNCGLDNLRMKELSYALQIRDLPNLEVLDLEGNDFGGHGLGFLSRALRVDAVPRLKKLNLLTKAGTVDSVGVSEFLQALRAEQCPDLENVQLCLGTRVAEEDLSALAAGIYPTVRTLALQLRPKLFSAFLPQLVGGSFGALDLSMEVISESGEEVNGALNLVGDALQSGRLCCLQKFAVRSYDRTAPLIFRDTAEGRAAFLTGLCHRKATLLSEISLSRVGLTHTDLSLLVEAVRTGNLSSLRVLDLSHNSLGASGIDALMDAVVNSAEGLPRLIDLNLTRTTTGAEMGGGSVLAALGSGKLPSLERLGDEPPLFVLGTDDLAILANGSKRFPPRLCTTRSFVVDLGGHTPHLRAEALIQIIAENDEGQPPWVWSLDLSGREEALDSLVASREARCRHDSVLVRVKVLKLASCGIGDRRLKRLGQLLSSHGCPTLETLDLSGNEISPAGFSAFIETLRPGSLPKLTTVLLGHGVPRFISGLRVQPRPEKV
mmetsp:Transcript_7961/g.15516  ORF Transcript_7961/g.15516 Transcript_7961/m.15516 type:complete len:755 (-) Transcript_7961:410-2674(-)